MVRQELKKIVVYTFFLAILFIPMLGFRTPSFEPDRVFKTLGVFLAILILNFIVKLIRSLRQLKAAWRRKGKPVTVTEPIGGSTFQTG